MYSHMVYTRNKNTFGHQFFVLKNINAENLIDYRRDRPPASDH